MLEQGKPGTHTVYLTVSNSAGFSNSKMSVVVTTVTPVALFTVSPSLVATVGQTITLTSRSLNGPTSFDWSLGDGSSSSSSSSTTYKYTSSGTFTITLTVQNSVGRSTTSTKVTVQDVVFDTMNI